jgi:DNA-binding NarL/FixJ family response regulator
VMSDTAWFSRSVMEKLAQLRSGSADASEIDELTARERQVLSHIARGSSNEAIAAELGLAAQTIRNYISSIYLKLGVHTRAEAIVWARERGLG